MIEEDAVIYLGSIRKNMEIGCKVQKLYEVSMHALEKQIPKKIIQPFGKGEGCYCPCCGLGVDKDYCGNCGQKLDWK